ncbi:MAG: response regulator [Candidatus Melainabacteria bacterium]|nr:response regulator [Candidatus Melainabacteria bacterium]
MRRPIEILLAEDRPADAELTQEVLEESGIYFNLTVVQDGVEAMAYLELADQGLVINPDLVLVDLNMPQMNGHMLLEKMRTVLGIEETPVVVLTVSNLDQDIDRALNLGMNYYLRKPARSETLGELVKEICDLWSVDLNEDDESEGTEESEENQS